MQEILIGFLIKLYIKNSSNQLLKKQIEKNKIILKIKNQEKIKKMIQNQNKRKLNLNLKKWI